MQLIRPGSERGHGDEKPVPQSARRFYKTFGAEIREVSRVLGYDKGFTNAPRNGRLSVPLTDRKPEVTVLSLRWQAGDPTACCSGAAVDSGTTCRLRVPPRAVRFRDQRAVVIVPPARNARLPGTVPCSSPWLCAQTRRALFAVGRNGRSDGNANSRAMVIGNFTRTKYSAV